jgi:hypothetical protein
MLLTSEGIGPIPFDQTKVKLAMYWNCFTVASRGVQLTKVVVAL